MSDKYPNGFTVKDAHEILPRHVVNADFTALEILSDVGRNRIFNLGYYTWVEQQGIPVEDLTHVGHKNFGMNSISFHLFGMK